MNRRKGGIITGVAIAIIVVASLLTWSAMKQSSPPSNAASYNTSLDFYGSDLSPRIKTEIVNWLETTNINGEADNITIRKGSFTKTVEVKPQYGRPSKTIDFILDTKKPATSFHVNIEEAVNGDIQLLDYPMPLFTCVEEEGVHDEICENILHPEDIH